MLNKEKMKCEEETSNTFTGDCQRMLVDLINDHLTDTKTTSEMLCFPVFDESVCSVSVIYCSDFGDLIFNIYFFCTMITHCSWAPVWLPWLQHQWLSWICWSDPARFCDFEHQLMVLDGVDTHRWVTRSCESRVFYRLGTFGSLFCTRAENWGLSIFLLENTGAAWVPAVLNTKYKLNINQIRSCKMCWYLS